MCRVTEDAGARLLDEARAEAAAQERRWLAREIHDGVIQDLAALGYSFDEVIAAAEAGEVGVPLALRDLRAQVSHAIRGLRQTIGDLRAEVAADTSLGVALTEVAGRLAERAGWQVHLNVTEPVARLPGSAEAALLRIAQEALLNVAKHAGASNVWVTCEIDPPAALLRVADDGVGLGGSRSESDSYGFVTMTERAQRLGASLSVRERRPTGTCITVRLEGSGGRKVAADSG